MCKYVCKLKLKLYIIYYHTNAGFPLSWKVTGNRVKSDNFVGGQ